MTTKQEENLSLNDFESLSEETKITIIAQYEAIRRSGKFNMYDFLNVQRMAFENEFYEFVRFTQNESSQYAQIMRAYGKYIDEVKDIPELKNNGDEEDDNETT